jgi:tetratricopeptide (TPR) repeat protein/predicted Ser/Thr protein kinase
MSDDGSDDATVAHDGRSPGGIEIPGYRILRQLGRGGMGAVYLAEDLALGRRVAIKVVADAIARDAAVRARFLREARLLATVEHPNVVRVYSFGASEERAYLVMEYVEGENLSDRIRRGPMDVAEAKEIVATVAEALEAAWEKRIVHRDIKPSNILFDRRGTLKVADFGLAKGGESADTESSLTQTGYILGSPHYVAPEQAQGRDSEFRADIYSLGVTLFEMLTARKPFEGASALEVISMHLHHEMPSLTSLRRDAPRDVVELVAWMTERDPARRPQSYRALIDAVHAPLPPGEGVRRAKQAGRVRATRANRPLLALAAILFIAGIAFLLTVLRHLAAPPPPADESRLVVAVAPFWGPDKDSEAEGRTMAALIQQAVGTRLGGAAKVIGIDETKTAVRDVDAARALGERLGASAVIWGQAFAFHNEREIQPTVTLIGRKAGPSAERSGLSRNEPEMRTDLPTAPEALRVPSQSANEIELRKTSAEGIGDLVTFVAAMHALRQNDAARALDLLAQTRRTPDALYQRAVCLAQMKRDDDALRELRAALAADPAHAAALALTADLDARGGRFGDAAAHLRAAAATGRRFTSTEGALYHDVLYVTERYQDHGVSVPVPTMLSVDPASSRVTGRWELPGVPQSYAVDESGMTLRYDIGPPRAGQQASLHFSSGAFDGPPVPHSALLPRLRRMKAAWNAGVNFVHDVVKEPRFRFVLDDPAQPKTLAELKAALEQVIARDPTQPWYLIYLAITERELGDAAAARQAWSRAAAEPFPGTPYYEWGWMARQLETFGAREWADQAYARSLQLRRSEPQPVGMTMVIERMLNTSYVRLAARMPKMKSDPERQLTWLRRTREVSGICMEGDDLSAFEWARWLETRHDPAAATEEAFGRRAADLFGMRHAAAGSLDVLRYLLIGEFAALLVMLAVVAARRRFSEGQRGAITALFAALAVTAALSVVAGASAARALDLPLLLSDSIGNPAAVAGLEDALPAHDNDDFRFLTAVANHMAGNQRRAKELYEAVGSDEAKENARGLDKLPANMPSGAQMAAAAQQMSLADYFAPLGRAAAVLRGVAVLPADLQSAAPINAAIELYLIILLGGAVVALLFALSPAPSSLPWRRAALALAAAVFVVVALVQQRAVSKKEEIIVVGRYSAALTPVYGASFPFPPLPDGTASLRHALTHAPDMRIYWTAVAAGALLALGACGTGVLAGQRRRGRRRHTRLTRRSRRSPLPSPAAQSR